MNFLNKYAGVIALVALIIAGVVGFSGEPSTEGVFGANECATGQTCLNSLELTGPLSGVTNALQIDSGKVAIGANGSGISQIISGEGAIITTNSTVVSSTTKAFDIAVTGVIVTDDVFVQAATTTAPSNAWAIVGAAASSTSGFITLQISNMTGATGSVPPNIASNTPYFIIRR